MIGFERRGAQPDERKRGARVCRIRGARIPEGLELEEATRPYFSKVEFGSTRLATLRPRRQNLDSVPVVPILSPWIPELPAEDVDYYVADQILSYLPAS